MASSNHSGFLLSQVIDYVGTPLTEEQVWALCYEICKRLVDTFNRDTKQKCREDIKLDLDTIYMKKDGGISFLFDVENSDFDTEFTSHRQMTDFGQLLLHCVEDFNNMSLELRNLVRLMLDASLEDTHGHWVHLVSDSCGCHASSQCILPSKYYRLVCKALVNDATEMALFLDVIKQEIMLLRSLDAVCAMKLFQEKKTLKNWLKVMHEIRDTRISLKSPPEPYIPPFIPAIHHLSPITTKRLSTIPETPELEHPAGERLNSDQPASYSTPLRAEGLSTKKVLRPPQRLVDEVTSWILEADEQNSMKNSNIDTTDVYYGFKTPEEANSPRGKTTPGKSPRRKLPPMAISPPEKSPRRRLPPPAISPPENLTLRQVGRRMPGTGYTYPDSFDSRSLYPNKWTELDSEGEDTLWMSALSTSERWFYEVVRIRGVLTAIQLDTDMEEGCLFDALNDGKICFCCRHVRFSIFGKMAITCDICERHVCSTCTVRVHARELGFDSRDCVMFGREKGILKQIKQVFKAKKSPEANFAEICVDCRDFIHKYC